MKKIMAFLLAMMLVFGIMPTVMAANQNEGSVILSGVDKTSYTIKGDVSFWGQAYVNGSNGSSFTYSDGVFTYTNNDENKKADYGLISMSTPNLKSNGSVDGGMRISNGTIEIKQTVIFSDPADSNLRPYYRVKNVSFYTIVDSGDIWIMNDGIFFDGTECLANTEYIITVLYNTDANTMTWKVENEELGVDISLVKMTLDGESGRSFDCPIAINTFYTADKIGATINVKDYTVSLKDLNFPHVRKMLYINGADEVAFAEDELVPLEATAVKAVFSGAISKSGTVATLKKVVGEEEVAVAVSETFYNSYCQKDGYVPTITVVPTNGFEPGASYKLYLSNLTEPVFGAQMPDGGIVKEFSVRDTMIVRAPENGALVPAGAMQFSAYIPYPENGVKFVLDGSEIEATPGEGNVYTASVETLAGGRHIFTATSGDESKEVVFTAFTGSSANNTDIIYEALNSSPSNLTVTKCTGVDGDPEGAVSLTLTSVSSEGSITMFPGSNQTCVDNRSVWFEADIKRVGNAGLRLYGRSSNPSGYPELTGGEIIKRSPNGSICGTSYSIAEGDAQWHKLRVIQQIKNSNDAKFFVYLDGVLVHSGAIDWSGYTEDTRISPRFIISKYSGEIQIDNAKYIEVNSPVFLSAEYKEDASAAEFTAASNGVISGVSEVIKLTQLNTIRTTEGATVTVNGVAATAEIDSTDANSLIITPANGSINAEEDVVITVNNTVTVLKADGDTFDKLGEVKAIVDGDTAVAKVKIAKATVGTSTLPETLSLIIASYDETGSRLKAINFKTITLEAGVNEYSTDIQTLGGGTKVRAMLWGGLSVIDPISADEVIISAE